MSPTDLEDAPTRPARRAEVDPRIQARRDEVARDADRRRQRRAVAVTVVVAVGLLAWAGARSSLLDVDRVAVDGARRTAVQRVLEAAAVDQGASMLGLDTGEVAARVEALPWVDDAEVVRHWPGTVEVRVTEREPVVVVAGPDGRHHLVDRTGRVLAEVPRRPEGLPLVEGLPAEPVAGTVLGDVSTGLEVVGALDPAALAELDRLVVASSRDLWLQLRSGRLVRWGPPAETPAKALALATVLARVELGEAEVIDVRVPQAPVVRPVRGDDPVGLDELDEGEDPDGQAGDVPEPTG